MGIKIKGKHLWTDTLGRVSTTTIELPEVNNSPFPNEDVLVIMKCNTLRRSNIPINDYQVVYVFPQEKQKAEMPAYMPEIENNYPDEISIQLKYLVKKFNQLIDVVKEMKEKE